MRATLVAVKIDEHIVIAPYTTFRMGGAVAFFAELSSVSDIAELSRFAREKKLPLIVLGGGSNMIFPDEGVFSACVGRIVVSGFEIFEEDEHGATLRIGAGEAWDSVVERSVAMGLSGIEALSAIPGTAGATPVQNVGAYGQEIADTLLELEAYDREEDRMVTLSKADCGFSYRDSKFKREWKDKYIITAIILRLSKKPPLVPKYPGVESYFSVRRITSPTLLQIREAIIEIRKTKLPDPREIASCGSFFKNPIVAAEDAARLRAEFPELISYPMQDGRVKLAAGWLIERLGLKGSEFGNIAVYKHNALVLVNRGGASHKELGEVVSLIQQQARSAFGVELEPEVVFVA